MQMRQTEPMELIKMGKRKKRNSDNWQSVIVMEIVKWIWNNLFIECDAELDELTKFQSDEIFSVEFRAKKIRQSLRCFDKNRLINLNSAK